MTDTGHTRAQAAGGDFSFLITGSGGNTLPELADATGVSANARLFDSPGHP